MPFGGNLGIDRFVTKMDRFVTLMAVLVPWAGRIKA